MGFPEDRRKILWSSSDGSHGKGLLFVVVGVIEVVFALSKVNDFDLIVGHDEEVGWFDVTMTYSFALKERAGGDQTAVHGH